MTTPTLEQALARIAELEHALQTVEAVRPAAVPKDPIIAMREAALKEKERREQQEMSVLLQEFHDAKQKFFAKIAAE